MRIKTRQQMPHLQSYSRKQNSILCLKILQRPSKNKLFRLNKKQVTPLFLGARHSESLNLLGEREKKVDEISESIKMRSKTIFVGGIGKLSNEVLAKYFEKFGNVRGVAPKQGFAFITFDSDQAATEACNQRFLIIGRRKVRLFM